LKHEVLNLSDSLITTLTAQGAGTVNSSDIQCGGEALHLGINVTAITGTSPTLTVNIFGKDASGIYYLLLASAALAATGFSLLEIAPGITAVANAAANRKVPSTIRVQCVVAGTTPSVTATIGASIRA